MTQAVSDSSSVELSVHDDGRILSRHALAELLSLAGPTVAQMASYTLMQFIDTWMLARVNDGVEAPTAAGNGGLLAFAVISFGVGLLWVVNTLVSQSYGRGDFKECGRYLWQGVWIGLLCSVLLLPVLPFVAPAFRAMGHPSELVPLETAYLKLVIAAAVFKLVGTAFGQFLLAIDRPGSVLAATIIAVLANAVAAWAMVFGHLGFKPMGVVGAAWGQNVGVAVEMVALIALAFRPGLMQKFNLLDWRPRWVEMKSLLGIGISSGVQMIADVLAWSMFGLWVIGLFGTNAMAAQTFMFRYMVVSFMPAFGISAAVTALVGRYIGMGRHDIARRRAHLGAVLTVAYMLTCGAVFFFARHPLMALFTHNTEVASIGAMLLIFAAAYQISDAVYINYNGALRGAGDTFVPAVATGVLCWGITVFGGYLVARHMPQWGVAGPWWVATVYGMILGVFMVVRFRRGRWESIRLEPEPRPDRLRTFDVAPAKADAALGA